MPDFAFKARDDKGIARSGVIQAASRHVATSQLRERGWIVLGIDSSLSGNSQSEQWLKWEFGPSNLQIEISLQQMAIMIRSGMTLLAAIDTIVEQADSRALARLWHDVARGIQNGLGFSQALRRQRRLPDFAIRLVEVGEQTGDLEPVLVRAANTMRRHRQSKQQFWSATIYPALVLLLAIGVTIYLVVYLMPRLQVYLESLGRQLPAMTQQLINGTEWIRNNFVAISGCAIAAGALFAFAYGSERGRLWIDRGLLRIPVLGPLIKNRETATFARGLQIMLESGLTLTECLGTVQTLLRNNSLAQIVGGAREKIIRGISLSEAISTRRGFTPMFHKMVSVGQQSGEMARVMREAADYHDDQFRASVQRIQAIATPTITLLVGGVVGYIYIAFFLALFSAGG